MNWWGRVMTAVRAGMDAYNERALVPVESYGWDTYQARLLRYQIYTAYLNNTAYSSLESFSPVLKASNRLYKKIRGIYNPVARQNKLLISYIYGGSIDMEHLTGGAIPIVTANPAVIDAIRQTFTWSQWGVNKSLMVRWGASLGDVALKIVDDRERQKVRMEVLNPGQIRDVELDEVGNVKAIIIEYERAENPIIGDIQPSRFGVLNTRQAKTYTYTEKIDAEKFQTFKNGEPFPYYSDMNGQPLTEWPNEYGFVPVALGGHAPLGLTWNANAFYESLRKVDEVNDQASLLNDQVRKVVIPLLFGKNIRQKNDIQLAGSEEDKYNIIYSTSENSDLVPIAPNIDIAGVAGNIKDMLAELERDLPELALQRMRENGGNFTSPGVRAAYSDAEGRIIEARGNYDSTLVRALQMAISIGGYNGYTNFQSFNLDSYDRGDLDFYVKDRPVIADSLSLSERITFLGSVSAMPPSIQAIALEEMGYDDETIDGVVNAPQPQTPAPGTQPPAADAEANAPQMNEDQFVELAGIYEQLGLNSLLEGAPA